MKKILEDLIDQAKLEIKECDALLTDNGIAPAPYSRKGPMPSWRTFRSAPDSWTRKSPPKSRWKLLLSLVAASSIIGQCIREDIGALFAKYHATKMALGLRILRLSKEKGWLIPPPLQIKRPVEE